MSRMSPECSQTISMATRHFRLTLDAQGRARSLTRDGGEQLLANTDSPLWSLEAEGRDIPLDALSWPTDGRLLLSGEEGCVTVEFAVETQPGHLTFKVVDVSGVAGWVRLTMRLPVAVEGLVGEKIATVHGGRDAVGLQGLTTDCSGGAERTADNVLLWVTLHFPADHPAGGIALFACAGDAALQAIRDIEIAEGLPHPTCDGEWAKTSRLTRRSYLVCDFAPEQMPEAIALAARAGLSALYLPPWVWFPGERSFMTVFGHFGVNTRAFPGADSELRAWAERAAANGMAIGAHTMSAWISPEDSYVTPVPHPGLATWARGRLASDLDADSDAIPLDGAATQYQPAILGRIGSWYQFLTVRIGQELIRYSAVEGDNPAKVRVAQRGAYGTLATAHARGEEVCFLIQAYGEFFMPDPESPLLEEQAAQLADVMNRCRFGITSFDGLETLDYRGEWGMHRFVDAVYRHWDHHVTCDASTMTHYLWHALSRGNWGENMINLREEVERRSRLANVALQQRNLLPAALGWWPLRLSTPDYEATNSDDFEYILAKCAGYDACFCIETAFSTLQSHAQTGRILDLVRAWERLRHSGAFTKEQRALLRTNGLDFRLDTDASAWRVTPVKTDRRVFAIAPNGAEEIGIPLSNPYHAQPLRFTIRVMPALEPNAGSSVCLLPPAHEGFRAGPQAGSLTIAADTSQTGAPAYRVTCDNTEKFTVPASPSAPAATPHGAESSPPMRWHWPIGQGAVEGQFGGAMVWETRKDGSQVASLDLSHRRGLGTWVQVDEACPGATLFVELVDTSGLMRQYYIRLDEPGRRWVEWPNGEAGSDCYYDYEWTRAPDGHPWQTQKWFRYDKVTQVRLGIVGVPPGKGASAVIEGLCALQEVQAALRCPSFRVGARRMTVEGDAPSGGYLAYEGGQTATVYDANWGVLADLPVRGSLVVEPGDSTVHVSAVGDDPRPWLAIQWRVLGPAFAVEPPAA